MNPPPEFWYDIKNVNIMYKMSNKSLLIEKKSEFVSFLKKAIPAEKAAKLMAQWEDITIEEFCLHITRFVIPSENCIDACVIPLILYYYQ